MRRDIPVWLVGIALAALLVFADVKLDDKGVTLALASMFPMGLGIWRRQQPWRWGLLCALPLVVGRVVLVRVEHLQHWEGVGYAFAAVLPAVIGGYLGALCRRAVEILWQEKE
ncbi:MAG TPA: hypothetical protein VMS96_08775 [Terriglobales bacterium]|nr:hypothetical protein [Terriglobales bacterium]